MNNHRGLLIANTVACTVIGAYLLFSGFISAMSNIISYNPSTILTAAIMMITGLLLALFALLNLKFKPFCIGTFCIALIMTVVCFSATLRADSIQVEEFASFIARGIYIVYTLVSIALLVMSSLLFYFYKPLSENKIENNN